ncbi:LysR family transcriptional regulator [Alteromonas oceanisediminis]|uniref:LysR family transcriptional regulator n=1 Tax=Alteromonas oceanisediminis TaxID=2836180 RepID=UPI001BDAECF2|nr:LysR family transcriptional regulator [Alteromonas oceanisediminis]MBT0587652.1 LysR family transcriptional regulator [Alteromonas oceanisediminis]
MIDRQHLHILHAIAHTGTLTEAASELCLTQSALSHAIKKLEQQFAIKVWNKSGRRVQLTQSGELLLSFAKRVLPQFEHVETQLQQIAKGERGTLRIGMECHPCYQWLLTVIKPYIQQYPDIDVDVRQQFQFSALGALLEFDIDLIITPDPLHHEQIDYQPVFDYEHVLAVSAHAKLADRAFVEPMDLRDETLITYPVEQSRLDIFSRFLTPVGGSVKRHKIIETTEIMLHMVAANRGVAALPRWLVNQYAPVIPIKAVSLGEHGIQKSIYLGTRKHGDNPPFLQAFTSLAKAR